MTVSQIESRLRTAGASKQEASDLAPIMHLNGWSEIAACKPSDKVLSDARTWLEDWRAERRETALHVREHRQRAKDAGYRALAVSEPVFIGCGIAEW